MKKRLLALIAIFSLLLLGSFNSIAAQDLPSLEIKFACSDLGKKLGKDPNGKFIGPLAEFILEMNRIYKAKTNGKGSIAIEGVHPPPRAVMLVKTGKADAWWPALLEKKDPPGVFYLRPQIIFATFVLVTKADSPITPKDIFENPKKYKIGTKSGYEPVIKEVLKADEISGHRTVSSALNMVVAGRINGFVFAREEIEMEGFQVLESKGSSRIRSQLKRVMMFSPPATIMFQDTGKGHQISEVIKVILKEMQKDGSYSKTVGLFEKPNVMPASVRTSYY